MSRKDSNNHKSMKKGEKKMAVSMAVIPTLKGKAATSVIETLNTSKIKPYSPEEKAETEKRLSEMLQKRDSRK